MRQETKNKLKKIGKIALPIVAALTIAWCSMKKPDSDRLPPRSTAAKKCANKGEKKRCIDDVHYTFAKEYFPVKGDDKCEENKGEMDEKSELYDPEGCHCELIAKGKRECSDEEKDPKSKKYCPKECHCGNGVCEPTLGEKHCDSSLNETTENCSTDCVECGGKVISFVDAGCIPGEEQSGCDEGQKCNSKCECEEEKPDKPKKKCGNGEQDPGENCGEPGLDACGEGKVCSKRSCKCYTRRVQPQQKPKLKGSCGTYTQDTNIGKYVLISNAAVGGLGKYQTDLRGKKNVNMYVYVCVKNNDDGSQEISAKVRDIQGLGNVNSKKGSMISDMNAALRGKKLKVLAKLPGSRWYVLSSGF